MTDAMSPVATAALSAEEDEFCWWESGPHTIMTSKGGGVVGTKCSASLMADSMSTSLKTNRRRTGKLMWNSS